MFLLAGNASLVATNFRSLELSRDTPSTGYLTVPGAPQWQLFPQSHMIRRRVAPSSKPFFCKQSALCRSLAVLALLHLHCHQRTDVGCFLSTKWLVSFWLPFEANQQASSPQNMTDPFHVPCRSMFDPFQGVGVAA